MKDYPCPECGQSVVKRFAIEVEQLGKTMSSISDSATSLGTSKSIIYVSTRQQQVKIGLIFCTGMGSAAKYSVPRAVQRHVLAGPMLSETAEEIAGVLDCCGWHEYRSSRYAYSSAGEIRRILAELEPSTLVMCMFHSSLAMKVVLLRGSSEKADSSCPFILFEL